ncbi:MAG: hypothetical protein FWG87_08260 [Defluviitaleaceae bacterium]|nr:hypothetical protein [Defluviitaleaceae bacterium]
MSGFADTCRLHVDDYMIFQPISNADLWASIQEVEPDEIDKQMLFEMQNDPECHDFTWL